MNRRQVLGAGAALTLTRSAFAQIAPVRVKITELERLKNVWDDTEFEFAGEPCVLVRVPAPAKPGDQNALEVQGSFFTAFSRVCTHLGCLSQLPNGLHQLECGCHGSVFTAAGGGVVSGPASVPLKALRLEIEASVIYAVAWAKPT